MMTIIANIVLVVAAVLDLCVLLFLDIKMLRLSDYNTSRYYNQLIESGEFSSMKRLLVFAVLIGACTTMARMSWMVMMVLAAVILGQAIVLAFSKISKQGKLDKRDMRLYITTVVFSLLLIGLISYICNHFIMDEASQVAALSALLLASASPLIIMLVNLLLNPRKRHNDMN